MSNRESQAFLDNVRTLARECGLSLRELEKACGLCPGYLTRAPRTGKGITLQTAVALAREMHMPIDDLIQHKASPQSINEGLIEIDTQMADLHRRRAELLMEIGG